MTGKKRSKKVFMTSEDIQSPELSAFFNLSIEIEKLSTSF